MTVEVVVCGPKAEHMYELVRSAPDVAVTRASGVRELVAAGRQADCAVLAIDATGGLGEAGRSDAYLLMLLGIPRLLVAIEGDEEPPFTALVEQFDEFIALALDELGEAADARQVTYVKLEQALVQEALAGVEHRHDNLAPGGAVTPADQLQATIVWTDAEPLLRGRSYTLVLGDERVEATVAPIKYRLNLDSLEHVAANRLERDEIGVCNLELSRPVRFTSYSESPDSGGFQLIDSLQDQVVGVGLIRFELRRAQNLTGQRLTIDRAARAQHKRQKPCVLWLTGLSGAGKSTIANLVEVELHRRGLHTYILDGDNVRHGLNRDLGFSDADRVENIRRVAEVSRLMIDAGLIVLVSFISPFASERQMARRLFDENEFFEVFVDAPLDVVEARDPKGHYQKARRGELRNFTGIDSPYEPPDNPDLHLDTAALSPERRRQPCSSCWRAGALYHRREGRRARAGARIFADPTIRKNPARVRSLM